jgi:hypothetical protein
MSTSKSKFGNLIHEIGAFVSGLFTGPNKITTQEVVEGAADIAAVANIYQEVKTETQGITDPAQLATAIAQSILKHESKLPANMQGSNVEAFITTALQKLTTLPLDQIEAIAKAEYAKLHPQGN